MRWNELRFVRASDARDARAESGASRRADLLGVVIAAAEDASPCCSLAHKAGSIGTALVASDFGRAGAAALDDGRSGTA